MQTEFTKSLVDSQEQYRITLAPTKHPSIFIVELRLPFKTVYPGKLDLSGQGCFRAKRKREHIHKKLQSWGVCAEVVDRYDFKWISILCDGQEYITSKHFLLRFGRRLTFQNYEAQYLLPLDLWRLDAVREFEKQEARKPEQLSIFQAA